MTKARRNSNQNKEFDSTYNEPLLASSSSSSDAHNEKLHKMMKSFRSACLCLGFVVGLFVQLSTLGANFIAIMMLGSHSILQKSHTDIVEFSLLWSIFSSCLAVIILSYLRNIITTLFLHHGGRNVQEQEEDDDEEDDEDEEDALDELLSYVENRFVTGALLGVCVAWTVTDVLLGVQVEFIHTLIGMALLVCWCKAPILKKLPSRQDYAEDEEDEEEDVPSSSNRLAVIV